MPYLSLQTNASLSQEELKLLATKLAGIVSTELGKSLNYVQIHIQPDTFLSFSNSTDLTAFIDLRSLGFPTEKAQTLSETLCEILQQELSIPPERVFLNFQTIQRSHWGWNSRTFA
jgi:phenylpyruvate tautomerase PptA (4-oxalocrotonate tautomerase family)